MSPTPFTVLMTLGGGGHRYEALRLAEQLHDTCKLEYVTSDDSLSATNPMGGASVIHVVPSLGGLNRSRFRQMTSGANALLRCVRIVAEVRPDLVIGVGSSLSVPLLAGSRLLGVRGVFVESITRVSNPSTTLKLVQRLRLAKRCYVQWPELAGKCGAVFCGNVL